MVEVELDGIKALARAHSSIEKNGIKEFFLNFETITNQFLVKFYPYNHNTIKEREKQKKNCGRQGLYI